MIRLILVIAGCVMFSSVDLSAEEPPIRLLYEVDVKKDEKVGPAIMERLVATINRRVNPGSLSFLFSKTKVRQLGDRQIEILVPADKPKLAARIERIVDRLGTLEFRILANHHDHKDLIDRAIKEKSYSLRNEEGDSIVAFWIPVVRGQEESFSEATDIVTRTQKRKNGKEILEVLVVKDEYDVSGLYLQQVRLEEDFRKKPCIHLRFNRIGGKLFGDFTEKNRPDNEENVFRKLGIILDGTLYSAPVIRETIRDQAQITGDFTKQDVQDLVDVLNSGSLPLPIKKVE